MLRLFLVSVNSGMGAKGCSGEDYTGFFQTAGYIEQNTVPVCDSEQYCICTEIQKEIFYGEHKAEIGKILRELCEWKGVNIVEAEVCPDHIHMLVEIPPKESVSGFMGFLKGKSSILIHERHGNPKYKYGNRSFWCRGYYVDTVGKNAKKISEYIQNQLHDQLTLKEYTDPFNG